MTDNDGSGYEVGIADGDAIEQGVHREDDGGIEDIGSSATNNRSVNHSNLIAEIVEESAKAATSQAADAAATAEAEAAAKKERMRAHVNEMSRRNRAKKRAEAAANDPLRYVRCQRSRSVAAVN